MINKLPSISENNFVIKLKRFFAKFFAKNEKNYSEKKTIPVKTKNKPQENVFEQMKQGSKKANAKEEIFRIVRSNQEALHNLTLTQLEEINKIYEEKIAEKEKRIKRTSIKM